MSRPPKGQSSAVVPSALAAREQPGDLVPEVFVSAQEFEEGFGESLAQTLDLETWGNGSNLNGVFERLEHEVSQALREEDSFRADVRKRVLPLIASRPNAPKGAGVFRASRQQLIDAQVKVLFNGGIEACDGTCPLHDALPLTVTQIGVCLVSYLGGQGAWGHRLYRKDLRIRGYDPIEETLDLLQRRQQRAGIDPESQRDRLSALGRRGIMTYAERAVLLHKAKAPWRMGHGHPAPYELLTGSGSMELLRRGLEVLGGLILDHRRFVFIPIAPHERLLLTIGHALLPGEFAIVETSEHSLEQVLRLGHLRGEHRRRAEAFIHEAGPKILAGVYRTFTESPPQVFYAHADFAQEAAVIAMADSLLQAQRAFPTLIDLADAVCNSLFGAAGFHSTVQSAYASYGHPPRYLDEHPTRR